MYITWARRKDGSIDALTAGISFVDNALIDIGVLDSTDIATDALDIVSAALPLATIALTEGTRVLTGKRRAPLQTGCCLSHCSYGLAMGAGAIVAGTGGALPAIPISIGVRVAMDRYRSRAMTNLRAQRIARLRSLREQRKVQVPNATALNDSTR